MISVVYSGDASHVSYVYSEGSATIPNHVDGFRNNLESLLESENQVDILESRIIISTFILGYLVFFRTL